MTLLKLSFISFDSSSLFIRHVICELHSPDGNHLVYFSSSSSPSHLLFISSSLPSHLIFSTYHPLLPLNSSSPPPFLHLISLSTQLISSSTPSHLLFISSQSFHYILLIFSSSFFHLLLVSSLYIPYLLLIFLSSPLHLLIISS